MFQKLLWIAFGGALGTLARYGMSGIVQKWLGPGFPWGTAAVNVIGSFLFGMLWAIAIGRGNLSADMRTVLFIGVIGLFTTFQRSFPKPGN
jgi:fluoride exporter